MFKFGAIVINTCAGSRNPKRKFMIIGTECKYIFGITKNGSKVYYNKHDQKRDNYIKKIGHIDITEKIDLFKDDGEMWDYRQIK